MCESMHQNSGSFSGVVRSDVSPGTTPDNLSHFEDEHALCFNSSHIVEAGHSSTSSSDFDNQTQNLIMKNKELVENMSKDDARGETSPQLIPSLDTTEQQEYSKNEAGMDAIVTRCFSLPKSKLPSLPLFSRFFIHSPTPSPPCSSPFSAAKISKTPNPIFLPTRTFCTPPETPPPKKRNPKLVNFSLASDSESDSDTTPPKSATKEIDKSKLPPPYNPFSKKPVIEDPEDPKNLQEVFAKIREDGLMNSAIKMFDGLSQDGLTHEALELFSQIKDKGQMSDVVAHTAVMEAYMDAGQASEAHKVYLRMLASGVLPNAYTYRVVIRGLVRSGDAKMAREAKKYVGEMVGRRMRPNAEICVGVFDGLVKVGMEDEGREMVEMLKENGFVPEENKVREVLKNKRGSVYGTLMSVLYGK
ncbi:hypothetical protein DH2020_045897 [Rehmannia glutinosa]|uniref:Pentatricopeptide repeat-containing protein n=1 Tax=Rehmannia glutinosa TaxID=99300 RepID=A0ABR0UDF0_REHGL